MMAHELPIPMHGKPSYDSTPKQRQPLPSQTPKKTKSKGVERTLPSGEPVDFGGKKTSSKPKATSAPSLPDGTSPKFHPDAASKPKKTKTKKSRDSSIPEPSLPNGAKPNFYNNGNTNSNNNDQGKSSRSVKKNEQTLPNGAKPNFNPSATPSASNNKKNSNSKNKKVDTAALVVEETYAGSSFHSSPAALNLPKPSFKTSPKSSNLSTKSTSPQPAHQERSPMQPMQQQQAPSGQYTQFAQPQQLQQPHHPGAPPPHPQYPYQNGPIYPVAAYPHTSLPPSFPSPNQNPMIYRGNQFVQPGFTYQHSPQGYITYQGMPQQMNPQGLNGAPYPPTNGFPQAMPIQQGQKISFGELLDSGSK